MSGPMYSLARAAQRLKPTHRSAPQSQASVDTPIRGSVDEPAAGARLWRAVPAAFRGWALEGLEPVAAVDIVLNGERRVPARLGRPRPDVPAGVNQANASPGAGWIGSVDLSTWPDSEVHVQVIARGRSGNEEILLDATFPVRMEGYAGAIDGPVTMIGNVLMVRGWATVDGRGPSTVDIEADGVPAGRARLRVPPPDAETHPSGSSSTWFEHAIVLDASSDGVRPHTVGAVVTGMDGSRVRLDECTIQVTAAPGAAFDAPQAATLRARTQMAIDAAPRPMPRPSQQGRIRLAVFTPQLDLSGAQLYLHELLRQLVLVLDSCTVVSPVDGELRTELELLGVDVVITGQTPPSDMVPYEGRVRELAMLIRGTGCEAVLVNTLGEVEAADAASRLGIPTIWAIHESFEIDHWLAMRFHGAAHPYLGERLKATLGAATRLVFVAQATSDMFAAYARPDRRVVVPYGVDVDGIAGYSASFEGAAARRQHGIGPDATVLLCVGTVEERKSQACLVEAFADLAADHRDASLVIVGDRGGSYSAAVRRQIESLDLGDRILLLPVTKEIWEWYALADLLVSASDVESLPRTMLEAMAFGLPVLAANVFGIPDLVRDGENGWLFEPRNMRALVTGMRRVLDLPAHTREQVGQVGRSLARQRYQSTNYAHSYTELLGELTSPTPPV